MVDRPFCVANQGMAKDFCDSSSILDGSVFRDAEGSRHWDETWRVFFQVFPGNTAGDIWQLEGNFFEVVYFGDQILINAVANGPFDEHHLAAVAQHCQGATIHIRKA